MRCLSSSWSVALVLLLAGCASAPPPPPPPQKVTRVAKPKRRSHPSRRMKAQPLQQDAPPPQVVQQPLQQDAPRPQAVQPQQQDASPSQTVQPLRQQDAPRPQTVQRPKAMPVLAAEPLSGVKALALHGKQSCALLDDGRVACWGDNSQGQIPGRREHKVTQPHIIDGVSGARRIATGRGYACALSEDEQLTCWGTMDGVFGRGMATVRVDKADSLAAAGRHLYVPRRDGAVWCFGSAQQCRHPQGAATDRPQLVSGLPRIEQVSGYFNRSCAVSDDGTVGCWGFGGHKPRWVAQLSPADAVEVGSSYACSIGFDQLVYCMGHSRWLPDAVQPASAAGRGPIERLPLRGLTGIVQLAMGVQHLCALSSQGEVYCVGKNRHGQLSGHRANRDKGSPRRVAGIDNAVAIAAGELHTCALLRDETVRCWGSNKYGQLGTLPAAKFYNPSFVVAATEPAPPAQIAAEPTPAQPEEETTAEPTPAQPEEQPTAEPNPVQLQEQAVTGPTPSQTATETTPLQIAAEPTSPQSKQ